MDLSHCFETELNSWLDLINKAVKKELKKDMKGLLERYNHINSALKTFLPLAEDLPEDTANWIFGEDNVTKKTSDIQFIMELLIQSLYLETCHLWSAANHSTRCAFEHTFMTIWHIGYPSKIKKIIGGPNQPRFSDIRNEVFALPKYKMLNNKFKYKKRTADYEIGLQEKSEKVYSYLSHYVHTSNVQIEMKGTRPHITYDLGYNPRLEKFTTEHFNRTFEIITTLLCIAFIGALESEHLDVLQEFMNKNDFNIIKQEIK